MLLTGGIGLFINSAIAQRNAGGYPDGLSGYSGEQLPVTLVLSSPDQATLALEDEAEPMPYRFAVNLPVDLDLVKHGTPLITGSGDKVWQMRIDAPGALAMIPYFDRFWLPSGSRLFVYEPEGKQVLGAFTEANNNEAGTFATTYLRGESIVIEYAPPAGTEEMPLLHLNEIGWAYRGIGGAPELTDDFGQSGNCEVNVNCPEGNGWKDQKRGVARIQVKRQGGTMWCSGSLINNVRHDGTPYFLTADHCGRYSTTQDLTQWVFAFHYESATCPDPPEEPGATSFTGAVLKARGGDSGNTGSDFFMVLLNDMPEPADNLFFNGWDRNTMPSPYGTGIHHPAGDIQKISTYTDSLVSSNWAGHAFQSHWRVHWVETESGHGVTEGGSSGSPIYNNDGRIVGTLTGGDSSCEPTSLDAPDYYGKFSWHWDKNGSDSTSCLNYWLDPDETGVMAIDGWTVGLAEQDTPEGIRCFPNPFLESVTLTVPMSGTHDVALTDQHGWQILDKQIHTTAFSEVKIDLPGLAPGIYLLRVSTKGWVRTLKLVKL